MQENVYFHSTFLCSNRIDASTPTKQRLLQEIDEAMIDNSRSESLRKKIRNAIQDLRISDIPFMRDGRNWKVKE